MTSLILTTSRVKSLDSEPNKMSCTVHLTEAEVKQLTILKKQLTTAKEQYQTSEKVFYILTFTASLILTTSKESGLNSVLHSASLATAASPRLMSVTK